MKTTKKDLPGLRSMEINKEEIMYCKSDFGTVCLLRAAGSVVTFYGSLQIIDGLWIMN